MTQQDMILAIDQGTTSSRAIVFDAKANIVALAQQEFPQHYPEDGWVEHDPEDIWDSTLNVVQEAKQKAEQSGGTIVGIGITNQRETTVLWDRATGKPIYNAIVWQDRRTAEVCRQLSEQEGLVQSKTGLLLDPYFSATKVAWILDNVEGARDLAEKGRLCFGTVDTFLINRLTGGESHFTDATNASRTNLFNIHTQTWDEELLALFRVPAAVLPEVKDCADHFGETTEAVLGDVIPILGVAGDQQAAAIGQGCFKSGEVKSTYGTGCFALMNTGDKAVASSSRLLTTVAYRLDGKPSYALEGSIFVAGAAIQWLRDGLGLIENANETESMAAGLTDNQGVYLVPAFTGLGAPHWDPDARGAIYGLTRDTGPDVFVRAALESVCYQTFDLLSAMSADAAAPLRLRVDGGMVNNAWVMNYLSAILDIPVDRPKIVETTALGVAYLAGLKLGIYGSFEDIAASWQCDRTFSMTLDPDKREALLGGWHESVNRTLS